VRDELPATIETFQVDALLATLRSEVSAEQAARAE
jgi:hypothetical protein